VIACEFHFETRADRVARVYTCGGLSVSEKWHEHISELDRGERGFMLFVTDAQPCLSQKSTWLPKPFRAFFVTRRRGLRFGRTDVIAAGGLALKDVYDAHRIEKW
jgi:hypothetical protein